MRTGRWGTLLTGLGTTAVIAAALVRLYRLDAPAYAMSLGSNTIDVRIDESPARKGSLKQRFELNITNTGRKPFRIRSAQASCTCTIAGEISGEAILAGKNVAIPLDIQFPAYGSKLTSVTIHTDAPPIAAVPVKLQLHGPKISAPFIESQGRTIQFTTQFPGEFIEHEFEVLTTEHLSTPQWIERLIPSYDQCNVQLVGLETLSEYKEINIAKRRYLFRMELVSPDDENSVALIKLEPKTNSPAIRGGKLPTFRCAMETVAAN